MSQLDNNNNNNNIHHVQIRSLKDYEEIIAWTTFCAQCFSSKDNPPSADYFLRHFTSDSLADISLIFVAVKIDNDTEEIVSSIRLFRRQLYQHKDLDIVDKVDKVNNKPPSCSTSFSASSIDVVGVGEVCTKLEYRRQGISSLLLRHALEVATSRGYPYAILHAAEWIRPYYRKFGFKSLQFTRTLMKLESTFLRQFISLTDHVSVIDIRQHIKTIVALNMNQNSLFSGCVVRSPEYISSWLYDESNKGLTIGTLSDIDKNDLDGYMVIRRRGSKLMVTDMCIQSSTSFWKLLIGGTIIAKNSYEIEANYVEVVLPSPFLLKYGLIQNNHVLLPIDDTVLGSFDEGISCEELIDDGWMTMSLGSQSPLELKIDMFWLIDSF